MFAGIGFGATRANIYANRYMLLIAGFKLQVSGSNNLEFLISNFEFTG